jgi:hypothetical protein
VKQDAAAILQEKLVASAAALGALLKFFKNRRGLLCCCLFYDMLIVFQDEEQLGERMTIDSVTPADRQRVIYSTCARSNCTISFNNYLTQEVVHRKLFVELLLLCC